MNGIISSRDGHSEKDRRYTQGSRRGRASGRRRPRLLGYEPLESRRLLANSLTNLVAEFPLRADGGVPEGGVHDGNGNLWVLLSNQNLYNEGTGVEYHIPTYNGLGGAPVGSELGLITYDAKDNGIWFYESTSNVFGMLNLANDTITEYPALFFSSDPTIVQITAGPDGNIWFTEPDLNEIGMFDTTTDIISQFTMPLPDTQPQGIVVGADGNLWFTEGGLNQLGSLNPYTHVLNQYPYELPSYTNNDQAEGITAGPNDTLWFVENQNNVIKGFTLPDQANNFQGAFMANMLPAWPSTGTPPNPLPYADLWSIGEEPDGNIYYTEPATVYNSIGIVELNADLFGYNDYLQNVSPQPPTNFTNALVVPATTGGMNITEPTEGELLTIGLPASKTTPSTGLPPTGLPSVIPSDDANDVITVGNDLWYTDTTDLNGEIAEFDPSTQLNTIYQLPEFPSTATPPPPQDPDQMALVVSTNALGQKVDYIWFTEEAVNAVGYLSINTVTGATAWYQTALTGVSSTPTDIAWDSLEDEFWMTEPASNQIINFNPTTAGSAKAPITIPDPVGVLEDPSTGYLWITEGGTNDKIVEYSPINEKILYTFNTTGSPANLMWGPDGNIWFTEANGTTGLIGILTPPNPTAGTSGSLTEVPTSGPANSISVGPSNYPDSLWFTETNSNQIGEITYSGSGAAETFAVQGYVTTTITNANTITLGPDGNEWFTSGSGTPAYMGAVVLNPADLGTQVVVTTQPTNVEETIFGGFSWGFGLTVAVENSAGEIDPFVQEGSITIALENNPTGDKLDSTLTSLTAPLDYGLAIFGGITMDKPAIGYTFKATYSLPLLPNPDTVETDPFDVAGPAQELFVTTGPPLPPSSVQAGVGFGLTVSALDFEAVVVPSFDDPVSLSILANPPGITGVLNGTTVVGALYGVANFTGLTIDQSGDGYTIEATDISPGTTVGDGVTDPFNVSPGPATQLVFSTAGQPDGDPISTAVAGTDFANPSNVVVYAEDQFGSLATSYNGPVTIELANSATGTFNGPVTVDAKNGVATFTDLVIDTVGKYQLEATSGTLSPSLTPSPYSTSITITPAAPEQFTWVTQPPTKVTEGIAFGGSLDIEDQYGNLETSDDQEISVLLDFNGTSASADLAGTTSVAADDGVVTFSNLIINGLGEYFTITASSGTGAGSFQSMASTGIDVIAPEIIVTSQPTETVTSGVGFPLSAEVETAQGALYNEFSGTETLTILSGPTGATIGGTTTATATAGLSTFSNVILTTPGEYVLQVSGGNLIPGDTETIDVVEPQLVVTSQPTSSVTAGASFPLTVQAQTAQGTVDTVASGTDTLTILSGPTGATIGGTATASDTSGVATFSGVILDTAGSYVLQVTNGDMLPGDTETIVVDASTPTGLVILEQPPTSVVAGVGFGFEVTGTTDQFGNAATLTGSVTVAIGLNPGGSTLGGTLTVPVTDGVATFSGLTLNKVGDPYTLVVTSGTFASITTNDIQVTPADASQLVVATGDEPPSQVTAGAPFSWTLDALDPFGNLDTNFGGLITVTQPGIITGTTAVSASGGVVRFSNLKIDTVGTYTLTATGTSENGQALTSVTSTSVKVVAAAPAQVVWTTEPPSQVLHNVFFGAAVDVEDAFGNLETTYDGDVTVALDSNPDSAALGGTTTIPASDGTATFSGLTISAVGSGYTLVATTVVPTNHTLSTVQSTPIQVLPDPAASLELSSTLPTSVPVNTSFNLAVTVLDQEGNPDPDFTGTVNVAIASSSGTNTLGGPMTATPVDGVATFTGLTLADVGSVTLEFSSPNLASITTGTIDVVPGTASKLVVITQPQTSETAGSPFGIEVEAEDQYGNLVTNYDGTVTAAISGGVSLSGGTSEQASGGIADFTNLIVDQAGSGYKWTAAATSLSSATTDTFSVTPAAPAQLVMPSQPPTSITAGKTFGLSVAIEDAYRNVVTSDDAPVDISLSLNQGVAPLIGTQSLTAVDGLVSFSGLAEDAAASGYTIVASSAGLNTIISNPIDVTPATATQLVVTVPAPRSMAAGSAFGMQVSAEDQYGNVVTGYNGTISVALAADPSNATLLGGPFVMTPTAGNANFSPHLMLDTAASGYTLVATSNGLTPVDSGAITITPGAATHLAVVAQPPSTVPSSSTAFGFVVAAEDQYGNVATSYSGQIQVATPAGSGASLGGTTSVTVGAGLATFQGLTLSGASSPVPLQVSGAGLTGASTNPVSLTGAVPAQLQFSTSSLSIDENVGTATFEIVRSGGTGTAVSVNVATSGGTAVAGVNYKAINETVNFAAGQTTQTVTIPIDNAGTLAQAVTVNISLSSPGSGASLGSPSTATLSILNVGASTSPTPPVTLESVQVIKKKHKVKEVLLTFSGGLNATEANSLSEYQLIEAGKRGSFTVKSAKAIKLLSAVYNSANDTVALTPKKAFVLTKAVELIVNGQTPSGLEDSNGRLIDGNGDGQAGSNAIAMLTSKSATVESRSVNSAAVDLLLQSGDLAALTKARKS
jgi:streptogramin lyase